MSVGDWLEFISKLNFMLSGLLILIVLRHYAFFSNEQQKDNRLSLWLRRLFIGDFLMGVSVLAFNVTPYFFTIEQLARIDSLDIILKAIQTISILYAGWANVGLYKYIKNTKPKDATIDDE